MGIPAYFSHLVKNYSEIITKLENLNKNIDNFYLDCNSIIYDSARTIEFTTKQKFEKELIKSVCEKIDNYIFEISPRQNVFISFDGVAPVAKLQQQRIRRFKSNFQAKVMKEFKSETNWDLANITPGTDFMHQLSNYIEKYYTKKEKKYKIKKFIISTSNDPGEGEHKLYEYIRNNPTEHFNKTTVVYGIDADLIMLCLNHLPICNDLYLYRETPYFIKSLCSDLEPDKCYAINIPKLSNIILKKMKNYKSVNNVEDKNKIYDYILLGFMLGNDFLPHFPSVNIRTQGIDILMNNYYELFNDSNACLTNGKVIYWQHVRKLVEKLAQQEEDHLKNEYKIRSKWEKRNFPKKTTDEKLDKLNMLPIKKRDIEKMINPYEYGWKERYYRLLLGFEPCEYYLQKMCINYLEGLEWTLKYYSDDCYNWRWKYNYDYPPLFCDLLRYIPIFNTPMVDKQPKLPIHQQTQLSYVLPKDYSYLIRGDVREKLRPLEEDLYPEELHFQWAFCKYFWESHIELPELDVDYLESIIINK